MTVIENKLRHISTEDLAILGMTDVAYVKRIQVEGGPAYEIHAADGTPVAVLPDRAVALATIRQHDLEPLSIH